MDGVGLGARSVQGLDTKSGLGLDMDLLTVKSRAKKMHGEEKSGFKKRPKMVDSIEARVDSDDDEPIGSLFKLKKPRNPTRVTDGSGGGGGGGKALKVEVKAEKLVPGDGDFGGMDDTLANFRKKLRGPKKDSGSITMTEQSSVLNELDLSVQFTDESIMERGHDMKSSSKNTVKGQSTRDNGLDVMKKDKGSECGSKRKFRRSKVVSVAKESGSCAKFNDFQDSLGPESTPSQNQREDANGLDRSLDENLEDSLAAFVQKAQFGSIRKTRTSSSLKQRRKAPISEGGLSPTTGSISEDLQLVAARGRRSASALKQARKKAKLESDLLIVSATLTTEPARHQRSPEDTKSVDGSHEASKRKQENATPVEPFKEPSLVLMDKYDAEASSDDRRDKSVGSILEDPVPNSQLSESHLGSVTCSKETIKLKDAISDRQAQGCEEVPAVEPCESDQYCDGDTSACVQVNESCSPPTQIVIMGSHDFKDGLKHCSVGKPNHMVHDDIETSNPRYNSKLMEETHGLVKVELCGGTSDMDQQSKRVSTTCHSSLVQKVCSASFENEIHVPGFDDNLSDRPSKNKSEGSHKQLPGKILGASSKFSPRNSSTCLVKLEDFSKSAFDLPKKEETCSDGDSLIQFPATQREKSDLASASLQENTLVSNCGLSPPDMMSGGADESELAAHKEPQEKCSEADDISNKLSERINPNELVASVPKCSSVFLRNQSSDGTSKGNNGPNHDYNSVNEETNDASSPSIAPDENEGYPEDAAYVPDPESKNNKLSVVQRAARKAKKHRHVDMAYEGDADWDSLIHVQGFLESHPAIGIDQASRMREKFDYSSNMVAEDENGGVAAVSAGLKARAVGPVEKIKFKEILKRKGGLQDYLECRNHILGLWSRDVSRILLLVDCGVTDIPANDEPPRASLTRDIYEFLDHRGYINAGIASKKKKAEFKTTHNYRLLEERNFDGNCGVLAADSEDGVSFILGQVKSTEAAEAKNDVVFYNEIQTSEPGKVKKLATLRMPELTSLTEPDKCLADTQEYGCINGIFPSKTGDLDVFISDPSCKITNGATVPLGSPEIKFDLHSAQYASKDYLGNDGMQCDSDVKKKIIVIGAGPAGLTAARHLQRRGFSVIVLEARNRIGGRVYTDRSSLSVPVDLGASIITGVEADAATERRPDPSSLICAQLGLELTVLNSDCPLYDIATGQKVPADLDEALEAEYNSLLDDMVLLVAQKGEHAMRMSLEDGLEYALKRRRIARSGTNYEGSGLHNSVNNFIDSEKVIVGSQTPESSKSKEEILSPLERRVMDWHFANLEYGCAALLQEVSLPYWNQDDIYGGFGGAHCMIKGGYSTVVESLGAGLHIHLNHMVTDVSYCTKGSGMIDNQSNKVKVFTSNGSEFSGDAVLITVPLGCLKAETIKFSPPLPQWKISSVERLGFGVLNKVVLEFPEVFWDNSVDYFGATAEETNRRGQCFMFWNVKKTVGAPVLIALVVGKAAIEGQNMSTADHVNHAVMVLRKLFGEASVPDPVASVVTDWGRDPFSYGAYSYVAVGASGEDYDILGQPVENCLFFAGEATCKEHPDTVGGAMMSGLREAVRIIDILSTGNDYTAEVEAMEAAQRHSDSERNEVRDIMKRLDAVELSNVLYKSSLDGDQIMTREALLQDMFCNAKTTAGRLHLAKELLSLPVEVLKSFAGTKKGLSILNSWILDSMGKDGTQLLRHCVRILVLVSTDLLAVRLSGIGKTVKEKVCVHTSRDIRAIASQLVSMWIEVFRKEKAANGGRKLLKQAAAVDSSKSKPVRDAASGKPPLHMHHGAPENKISHQVPVPGGNGSPSNANYKKVNGKPIKIETVAESKSMTNSSRSQGSAGRIDPEGEAERSFDLSEEEKAAFAAAEAARAAALAAAEAYASSEARCNTLLQLPKIPSFHKFARREQYAQMDESEVRRKWPGGVLGRQDCLSEIDSRNCRVRNWSVDFSAACVNLDSSRTSADNLSHGSHSNEIACQLNLREHSGESTAVDSSAFTKAWVDTAGCIGMKDYHAIERWQSQAMAVDPDLFDSTLHIRDEEDSTTVSKPSTWKHHHRITNESSVSHVSINKDSDDNHSRGAERIKQAVVDYVASLLMPLYKAKKIDKEGYKSIMKKTATKVMEQTTEVEKTMYVSEFLDFKRKNKIRAFVDKLIERHMTMKPDVKPDGPKV